MHDIECFIVGTWKRFINMHSILLLLLLLRFDNQFDKCRFVHYLRQHFGARDLHIYRGIYAAAGLAVINRL